MISPLRGRSGDRRPAIGAVTRTSSELTNAVGAIRYARCGRNAHAPTTISAKASKTRTSRLRIIVSTVPERDIFMTDC